MKEIVDSEGNRLALGDEVCFTSEAIEQGKTSTDVWDSLLRNVDPNARYEVNGFAQKDGVFLKGWNIIRDEKAFPITINRSAVRKAF